MGKATTCDSLKSLSQIGRHFGPRSGKRGKERDVPSKEEEGRAIFSYIRSLHPRLRGMQYPWAPSKMRLGSSENSWVARRNRISALHRNSMYLCLLSPPPYSPGEGRGEREGRVGTTKLDTLRTRKRFSLQAEI